MRLPRRQFLGLAAAATAVPALPRAVFAQSAASTWPNRVVRLIVGFPPGGGADSAARIAADRLSKIWGQQVVVENKGGAGGNIAHDTAAHAPPDGYTMLFSPSSLPIMPMLYPSAAYNPMTDSREFRRSAGTRTCSLYPRIRGSLRCSCTSTRPRPIRAR
jgi:tripartite-type tricarboxylate transporter receptor subunit TctC